MELVDQQSKELFATLGAIFHCVMLIFVGRISFRFAL